MAGQELPRGSKGRDKRLNEVMRMAEDHCQRMGARFTKQRRQVLDILLSSDQPLGAYDIMELMADSRRRPAPITVYRALDFLIENGIAHRLASLNAFVACCQPGTFHGAQFLICQQCGVAGEISDPKIDRAVLAATHKTGFKPEEPMVEIMGFCSRCLEAMEDSKAETEPAISGELTASPSRKSQSSRPPAQA